MTSRGRRRPARVDYRPATRSDLADCTRIWSTALEDYLARLNQRWFAGDLEPLERLLAHFVATDPALFRVATAPAQDVGGGERVVGFGSATVRGNAWFLGMLFVLPEFQGRGVGRALLESVMPALRDEPDLALGTATDSVQPISNALYSRYGMVPRLPVFNLVGYVEHPEAFPALPRNVTVSETVWPDTTGGPDRPGGLGGLDRDPDAAVIAAIDSEILGYAHPQDHAFLRSERRRRFIARTPAGAAVGYGYIAPSGRFGPVAARDPALLAPLVGHLLREVRAPGAYASWIPGSASDLFVALLRAGLRLGSFPTLLLWDRSAVDFARYVPINLALL